MTITTRTLAGALLVIGAITLVFWQMFVRLVDAWIVDGNYSHGFLIIPIAAYFAWERRHKLAAAPVRRLGSDMPAMWRCRARRRPRATGNAHRRLPGRRDCRRRLCRRS